MPEYLYICIIASIISLCLVAPLFCLLVFPEYEEIYISAKRQPAKNQIKKADRNGCSTYAVIAVNPNMFSYYTEVRAQSLIVAAELGLKKLSKKYPEEIFSRVEAELIE